jgi:hypothetical protein
LVIDLSTLPMRCDACGIVVPIEFMAFGLAGYPASRQVAAPPTGEDEKPRRELWMQPEQRCAGLCSEFCAVRFGKRHPHYVICPAFDGGKIPSAPLTGSIGALGGTVSLDVERPAC